MSDNWPGGLACADTPADSRRPAGTPTEAVQARVLPDGDALCATLLTWKGDAMLLAFGGREPAPGVVLEIEAGSMLYWGELLDRAKSGCWVRVEHSLDRSALALNRNSWG